MPKWHNYFISLNQKIWKTERQFGTLNWASNLLTQEQSWQQLKRNELISRLKKRDAYQTYMWDFLKNHFLHRGIVQGLWWPPLWNTIDVDVVGFQRPHSRKTSYGYSELTYPFVYKAESWLHLHLCLEIQLYSPYYDPATNMWKGILF